MAGKTITKKVRMDGASAARLRKLSRDLGTTESQVIRDALRRYEVANDREQAIQALKQMFPGPEPPKERYRFQ